MKTYIRSLAVGWLMLASADSLAASVSSMWPTMGPTTGGTLLAISGVDFGDATGMVKIGGATCAIQAWSNTSIAAYSPEGQGINLALEVTTASGVVAAANGAAFNYRSPEVDSLTPGEWPTTGGATITVAGANFGVVGAVTLGGVTQVPTAWSHTQARFILPPGGADCPVQIVAGGQSSGDSFVFRYSPPVITSLAPDHGPSTGGVLVSVSGSNFWTNAAVLFNTTVVSAVSVCDTALTFRLPPGSGGTNLAAVIRASQASETHVPIRYDPVITAVLSPTSCPTIGGPTAVVRGINFGATGTLSLGTAPVAADTWSETQIVFRVPPGGGCGLSVAVQTPQGLSAFFADALCYDPPQISSLLPLLNPTEGGTTNTITGSNFSTGGAVMVAGRACPVVSWSHTQIVSRAPAGEGRLLELVVNASGQMATSGQFSYFGPSAIMLVPSQGPVAGGVTVDLLGVNFGTTGRLYVADIERAWLSWSHTNVAFALPAGAGYVPVHLVTGGQTSTPVFLTYIPTPTLTGFQATPAAPDPTSGLCTVRFEVNVDPHESIAGVECRYGLTTNYGGVLILPEVAAWDDYPFPTCAVAAGMTYHWRVIATNAAGETVSPDHLCTIPSGRIDGDLDGDGRVTAQELGSVLSNYWPASPWLSITNAACLGTLQRVELDDPAAQGFSVEYTTDQITWIRLTNTTPAQLFVDPSGASNRLYRLRWP